MDETSRKIFKNIIKKAEIDGEEWDFAQSPNNSYKLSDEREEEILERMFLLYYLKLYQEQNETLRFMVDNSMGLKKLPNSNLH